MRKKTLFIVSLLLAIAQGTWAWDGSGTSADPYLIRTSADWKQLADDVSGGNSYSGKFFEMAADIDAQGISVGTSDKPFSGTFSGGMHTLTYNRGGAEPVDDRCAPFIRLDGATIRDLKVTGKVYSSHKFAGGIASLIDGTAVTTISSCGVSSELWAAQAIVSDATFGGLVGAVSETCTATPVIENCTFTGAIQFHATCSGGLVGYTFKMPVTFDHCLYDPTEVPRVDGCATFVRTAPGVECTFKECYYTKQMGTVQGEAVFREVIVPEGCTYRFVSEPQVPFNGVDYYKSGTVIELSVPDDVDFDHWQTISDGCWISNPWQRSGLQTVRDIRYAPDFTIATTMPEAKEERKMDGTVYRYLYKQDYHLYISDEEVAAKRYYFDDKGEMFKWDEDGKHVWVTAVTGWVPGKIPSDGAQIHNDLSGTGKDYTLLGAIAPQAFKGCTELKTLYFKDTDANNFNARFPFDFIIGDKAFADCPNLTEIKMMQYTTKGENHWEALSPEQVTLVGDSVFAGSPQANFTVDASKYQDFLSSQVWKKVNNRILIYGHTDVDMNVNGAQYSNMRNTAGEALKNDAAGHAALMETLRYWNADYQQFTASSLLSSADENIWYTQVVGVQPSSLDGGTMRIYNDPGSYYNYKTIALQSLGESKDVTAIEFWQTNGRSENSYTDMKMVIRNGALKGCSNLKEIRLFYYCQDGDNHWENLGPTDVIPGDNIFGLPKGTDLASLKGDERNEAVKACLPAEDFKIVVSPDRYQEFLDDPNWVAYARYITPEDFAPDKQQKKDFELGGLTYGYMTSPGGIMQTSQTVSQDVSWWTAPRLALEALMWYVSISNLVTGLNALREGAAALREVQDLEALAIPQTFDEAGQAQTAPILQELANSNTANMYIREMINKGTSTTHITTLESGGYINIQTLADGTKTFSWAEDLPAAVLNIDKDGIDFSTNLALGELQCAAIKMGNNAIAQAAPSALQQGAVWATALAKGGAVTTAGLVSARCWGGSGSYDGEALRKGMRQNILSNIHQVGLVGGSYVITTPTKNLVYHTYIKSVPDQEEVTIYAGTGSGQGTNNNARTMTWAKDAFHNKKNLKTIKFYENTVQSDEAIPMLLTIPDSAFVGCTNLTTIDLRVQTKSNGSQALGPESFILAGDNVFAGIDSTKIHIIIDPSRKQDFLDNELWAPMQQYFVYEAAEPETKYQEYGGNYTYAYENGTTQKVHKVSGHKIEHTVVTGADDSFLQQHQGALKLCNDIGVYNNYQLDAVGHSAFYGNQNLRVVNFTDLKGTGAFGDTYTDLEVTLQDSCFANCKNLADLDLLYLVTDGDNHIDAITPQQVKIGNGVLDGTSAMIKMMPQQVAWFEADSSWVKYKDRFMPCVIQPADKGFKAALKDMAYYDMAHSGYDPSLWNDYIDLARIAGVGFSWLDGKFKAQKDDILSLADFKHFESVGLNYVGEQWFEGLTKLTNIQLPSTIEAIRYRAFGDCTSLQEIEIPEAVIALYGRVFEGCTSLKTIVMKGKKPATLYAQNAFPKNEGMKIYVPAESVDYYKSAWPEYKDYIVSDAEYKVNKVVTLTEAGTLADKLGLSVEWSYTGIVYGDEPYLLHGAYAKYDSLTVSGPLNDLDLWVIRYLGGNNGYESGGKATDGCLRYLNLYDASIVKDKDCKAHYRCVASSSWQCIETDNVLPRDLFRNCTAFETVILPKSLTSITSGIFEGCKALTRVAITGAVKEYDGWTYTTHLFSNPLQELVLLTDQHATTSAKNPWGTIIMNVYTQQSQIGDYMNDRGLTTQARSIQAPFQDRMVMRMLADHGEFFPSEYLLKESVEGYFQRCAIHDFDDFTNFQNVKRLEATFQGTGDMKRIALPASVEYIGEDAFASCYHLDTIRVEGITPAVLAKDAFRHLPADFRILVPRRYAKRYRTEWAQYADHINADETYEGNRDILTVTVSEPNTLAQALGLNATYGSDAGMATQLFLRGLRGNYSHISKLKVVGPIGAADIDLLKYLSGYCSWTRSRNYLGSLQYLDLYDAQFRRTSEKSYVLGEYKRWVGDVVTAGYEVKDNKLPRHSFLRAYNLQTLILPKTCKEVEERALQECEGLETLVLGDDMEDFNWNALDDDAMLTRMYILAKKKPEISSQWAIWRWLCNNYNPTFDAFYVRPSQYESYLGDEAYTGSSWQRTNNVSTGVFNDDESFCAFASHGAATQDELASITSVKGWFDHNTGLTDLSPLRYTSIGYMDKATLAPLKELEQIAMPVSLFEMEEGLFENAKHLRAVDFLLCDSTDVVAGLRDGGFAKLGINTQQTLCYVPATYGETKETNVVVNQGGTLKAKTYRMVDSLDYVVPYEFEAETIENPRTLAASSIPYTVCVPYKMNVPAYARAYKLSSRDGNNLVFQEVKGELEAMHPYLLKVVGNKRLRKMSTTLNTSISQTIPASGGMTYGRQVDAPGYSIRGTFETIGNAEAAELGAYVLQSDGDWHPVTTAQSQVNLKPFRAFLLPSARTSGARIGMTLVDDATTPDGSPSGIDTIETIDEDGTRRYYDLNGREVDGSTKGIVIKNGKKVIRK